MRVLVTGATGYIGGRLVPRLLAEGHTVRCMTRDARRLRDVPWVDDVEIVAADALDPPSLGPALADVDVAYYLIHSIDTGGDFSDADRRAARAFAAAARAAGYGGWSTWVASRPPTASCRRTWPPAPRSASCCWTAACRPWSCGPRSSSAAAARRSRCCATSPNDYPS